METSEYRDAICRITILYGAPDTGYGVLFWECPDAWWVPRPSKPLRRRFARRLVGSIPIHSRNV